MDWPAEVHRVLSAHRVRQVAYVPDAGLAELLELCARDAAMRSIPLTAEQEGMGVLAGAWLGGERGVLLMQSSGVGNCLNALNLTGVCRFPLLMLVTMRGEWGEFNAWQVPMGQGAPRLLGAAGVIVERPGTAPEIAETLDAAARLAFDSLAAVAVLVSQRLIGFKSFEE